MKVVETFLSIQAEGMFSGRYAFFIRFAGCNFNCTGFGVKKDNFIGCDTIKAVQTKAYLHTYFDYNADELIALVKKQKSNPLIVITGGEPLLLQNDKEFVKLLSFLTLNYDVQFESNASIKLKEYDFYKKCYFAMGVKLANSGVKKELRINKDAIFSIIKNSKKAFFKFVINDEKDLDELYEIINDFKDTSVYLMPMGSTNKELSLNAKKVFELCVKHSFNYSDRLHIRIYDDKEGV
ncbi:7-carboxy-7-deazaguanine synthase QueE [Campylobacter canadensis]|uniref:7-carboxy-7-deazaguanine synthase QueE n=1 Tax=Campylobacter canadensis TaxID=449520 RepID=UPI0015579B4C|nr:7-carboxy-7-deazaguanine synthase QueE [Campylobacter canadensis]MBZ7994715.1 7-carboxy-7-deazaguanine synthase QueE [Campylobacter canadensis]MBZ7996211.1 7-carboxy-7-deazaguanine synthase QueE [Campylobacter canadensis]MBZ7999973.1 7-carboxy-7-deazaguanine synthase QueE [Campylobacter canadensis]MBZ8001642.1 7-carboxy-7-deazaguanine synthase QueE [Campylobacter canadensis]MBZ8003264.1 7-carboxy-7-deazaguanine synthase QueE [Campylobacter canadensis]